MSSFQCCCNFLCCSQKMLSICTKYQQRFSPRLMELPAGNTCKMCGNWSVWEDHHLIEKQFSVSWLELGSTYFWQVISDKFIFRDFQQDRIFFSQACFLMCWIDMHCYYKEQIKTSAVWLWQHKMCCSLGMRLKHVSLWASWHDWGD